MKDKLILVGAAIGTFLLNTLCYCFFRDAIWYSSHLGIFVLGVLYSPIIIVSIFWGALFATKRICGKSGISLAWFAVGLSALELVVQAVGFYICGNQLDGLFGSYGGFYYDLIAVWTLLIIGIIFLVSLVVLYSLCRTEGRLHPAVHIAIRFVCGMGMVVVAAYCVAYCLMMFCISLWAQDVTEWLIGKLLAGLVLYILLPGNIMAVSIATIRLNRRFLFLKEGLAQIAIVLANLLYLCCFHYSWKNTIWDDYYALELNLPLMWHVLLVADLMWTVILFIKLVIYFLRTGRP